jgi:serine/threonine protein kinase
MDRYKVEKVVGEGSFGVALLASDRRNNQRCIIKRISIGEMSGKVRVPMIRAHTYIHTYIHHTFSLIILLLSGGPAN